MACLLCQKIPASLEPLITAPENVFFQEDEETNFASLGTTEANKESFLIEWTHRSAKFDSSPRGIKERFQLLSSPEILRKCFLKMGKKEGLKFILSEIVSSYFTENDYETFAQAGLVLAVVFDKDPYFLWQQYLKAKHWPGRALFFCALQQFLSPAELLPYLEKAITLETQGIWFNFIQNCDFEKQYPDLGQVILQKMLTCGSYSGIVWPVINKILSFYNQNDLSIDKKILDLVEQKLSTDLPELSFDFWQQKLKGSPTEADYKKIKEALASEIKRRRFTLDPAFWFCLAEAWRRQDFVFDDSFNQLDINYLLEKSSSHSKESANFINQMIQELYAPENKHLLHSCRKNILSKNYPDNDFFSPYKYQNLFRYLFLESPDTDEVISSLKVNMDTDYRNQSTRLILMSYYYELTKTRPKYSQSNQKVKKQIVDFYNSFQTRQSFDSSDLERQKCNLTFAAHLADLPQVKTLIKNQLKKNPQNFELFTERAFLFTITSTPQEFDFLRKSISKKEKIIFPRFKTNADYDQLLADFNENEAVASFVLDEFAKYNQLSETSYMESDFPMKIIYFLSRNKVNYWQKLSALNKKKMNCLLLKLLEKNSQNETNVRIILSCLAQTGGTKESKRIIEIFKLLPQKPIKSDAVFLTLAKIKFRLGQERETG